ncbi:hypothetical protein Pcinc_002235 [Petrolisthes cinctipes]|uniref:Uncharacterized protein n=1 Tax=Petrolisthes cinctipes TaxID=88211 RepID=A0AAE1GLF4_PETCI|nr:hypothetical protein Pcinc_002235 [Petrolisthes cinctipes]
MRVFTGEDSVPKFDGDPNKNYTIEEFIRRLEQSFVEYNITEDRGKIGYADSRIEGEFARQLLNCSCLLGRSSREQQTWEEFKKALVIVYRRSAPEGCSAWAHRIFKDLGLKAWTTSLEVAVSKAGAIRKDIQDCIQDNNWSKDVNGEQWMKVDDACEMFEYLLMYLGLSEEDQRRVRKKKLERGVRHTIEAQPGGRVEDKLEDMVERTTMHIRIIINKEEVMYLPDRVSGVKSINGRII